MSRKAFRRLTLDERKRSLLEATLSCVAQHGLKGATVRRIAEEAGVTAGLLRHYFGSKNDLVTSAYAYLIGQLTADAETRARRSVGDANDQLRDFLIANMTTPNLSEEKVSLWATFVGRVRYETDFADIHREGYRDYLALLESLIEPVLAAQGLPHASTDCRRHAIAVNGLIDGLWMEGSLNAGLYSRTLLPDLVTEACERLLGLPQGSLSGGQQHK
ncbi:TetR family transcriptional regulator C-terminal domain-containing protein [Roseibium sp. AS2]|uniref:TetR family transcriptional regulator C-terminal domain-containing protein n=1 Tax=Roseibium sp. AS2 TaxID=3135781 RepID=UPI0031760BAE